MKPSARLCVGLALCLAAVGCGGAESRVWRGPRLRSGGYAADPVYAPPVEPSPAPRMLEPVREPMPELAPPVRLEDLQPPPAPTIRLEQELPAPPSEDEESVQFIYPAPPSSMPNALYPDDSPKPILEQSSAERPTSRDPREVLGEGKIALNMRGHSTFMANRTNGANVRLMRIEPEHDQASSTLTQVQYQPLLAPVPGR
jgi:hypothetical protein